MILGDCLGVMPSLPKGLAQTTIADLPYGVTSCSWDVPLDLNLLWRAISHIGPQATSIFTALQPFTTDLVNSRRYHLRHELIWHRTRTTGFFNARKAPLRTHENILVFGPGKTYNPQMTAGKKYMVTTKQYTGSVFGPHLVKMNRTVSDHCGDARFPRSVIAVPELDLRTDHLNGHRPTRIHATQKPLALMSWLVLTYSDAGNNVLDPCSGSGTTAVAALSSGRNVVCIEKDVGYFDASVERVRKHVADNKIDATIDVRR